MRWLLVLLAPYAGTAAVTPFVTIAPNVSMPVVNLGGSVLLQSMLFFSDLAPLVSTAPIFLI